MAGYIISEIRLTIEVIEKTLRFKHADIMKIPELDRIALFFQFRIDELGDAVSVVKRVHLGAKPGLQAGAQLFVKTLRF